MQDFKLVKTQVGAGLSPTCVTQASAGYSSVVNEARPMGENSCGPRRLLCHVVLYKL